MARSLFALLALLPVSAWGQSPSAPPPPVRSFELPTTPDSWQSDGRPFAAAPIAPNATFGIGMFGLRQERSGMAATTVREVNSPRTRRAAIGFSVKF